MPVLWMPGLALDVQTVIEGPGASQGINYEAGSQSLPCIVVGSSLSDLHDKMDAIVLALAPHDGEKVLKLDQIDDRFWYARVSEMSPFEHIGPGACRFTLNFIASDPHAWANSATSQSETINANPFIFTVPGSGAVAGRTLPSRCGTCGIRQAAISRDLR